MLATLAVLASRFSWELEGSIASLLGTGVTVVVRLGTSIELALVVSLRHWGDVSRWLEDAGLVDGEEVAPLAVPLAVPAAGVLEKKPRMLRCLPVDGAFLVADDGAFAGVRAAVADLSTILPCTAASYNDPTATHSCNDQWGNERRGDAGRRSWCMPRGTGQFKWNAKKPGSRRDVLGGRVHAKPDCWEPAPHTPSGSPPAHPIGSGCPTTSRHQMAQALTPPPASILARIPLPAYSPDTQFHLYRILPVLGPADTPMARRC